MDNTPSKIGIVVYSRSGHSRRLAKKLADTLDATIIELNAPGYKGAFGYMQAGYESLRQTCTLAPQSVTSLSDYDRIILCGPVWTSYPAAPLRGLLRSDITLPESVSLFLTSGGIRQRSKHSTQPKQTWVTRWSPRRRLAIRKKALCRKTAS